MEFLSWLKVYMRMIGTFILRVIEAGQRYNNNDYLFRTIPKNTYWYPLHVVIKNIAKKYSLDLVDDRIQKKYKATGILSGWHCSAEYLKNSSCIVFSIAIPANGFQPFTISNKNSPTRTTMLTGDTIFDSNALLNGSDDLYAVLVNSKVRQDLLNIATEAWSFMAENTNIMIRVYAERILEKEADTWVGVIKRLIKIAEHLKSVPSDIEKDIIHGYKDPANSQSVRMKCLQWLVMHSTSAKMRDDYIIEGLTSGDENTIEFLLNLVIGDPALLIRNYSTQICSLVLNPQESIWRKVIKYLKNEAVAVILNELEKMRTRKIYLLREYKHCFTVLDEINKNEYWKQLDTDIFKPDLPNDIRGFLFTEIINKKKSKYYSGIRKYVNQSNGIAAYRAVEILGETGNSEDYALLVEVSANARGLFGEAIHKALEKIKMRLNIDGEGWLSVADSFEDGGALSIHDNEEGSLSKSEKESQIET